MSIDFKQTSVFDFGFSFLFSLIVLCPLFKDPGGFGFWELFFVGCGGGGGGGGGISLCWLLIPITDRLFFGAK